MPGEPFTCPICFEEKTGNTRTRRASRRHHARRHDLPVAVLDALPGPQPAPAAELVIPAAPKNRPRTR